MYKVKMKLKWFIIDYSLPRIETQAWCKNSVSDCKFRLFFLSSDVEHFRYQSF